jgi:RNA polymerase sigma factor (sigma-70 family)
MSDVTAILARIERGDPRAAKQLLPLVYEELRRLAAQRLAQEKPGQTLQATDLVHEAYLRLASPACRPGAAADSAEGTTRPAERAGAGAGAGTGWNSRGHFFAAAAEAMRRILVENARRRRRAKHGGGRKRIDIAVAAAMAEEPPEELIDLDQALRRFEQVDALAAQVVKLRFFAGLTIPQAAEAMGLSVRTAERNWTFARTWLHRELSQGEKEAASEP